MCDVVTESPAPWETGALSDPIEVYDMLIVDDGASQSSMKRNQAFNQRLIRYVRKRRELYDPKHQSFSNIEAKVKAWEIIAKQMRCDVDICKNAWVNLRYSYQKYVRRLRKFFANKSNKKRKRRPVMAFETEMVFLWRFIANKAHCPLPYDDKSTELETLPAAIVVDDDDIVLLEDDVEVIDLDDDAANATKNFARQTKSQFQITPEMRRLLANIEPYQELYDSEHRYYEDYRRKGIIWNAIANEVGDKATKLMKCWVQLQTRYEWEIMDRIKGAELTATKPETELESLLAFYKPYILKMPDTVYKSSYFLKQDWHEPIDHFKNIFSLLVAMKRFPTIISLTETLAKVSCEGVALDENYTKMWEDVATARGGCVTAGQCEATWLILRMFYWELVNMRKHSYQLQDKWYFESIISELYLLAKMQKSPRTKSKQNITLPINADESPLPSPDAISVAAPAPPTAPTTPLAAEAPSNPIPQSKVITNIDQLPVAPVKPIETLQLPIPKLTPITVVPIPVNLDEDTISSSKIETKNNQVKNAPYKYKPRQPKSPIASSVASCSTSFTTTTANTTTTTYPNTGLVVTLTKMPPKTQSAIVQQETQKGGYPESKSPQIRVKSQAQLQGGDMQPIKMFVQTRPQLQIQPQTTISNQLQLPQSGQLQLRVQTPQQLPNPLQTITLPRMQIPKQTQFQMLPLTPIQAQSKMATKNQKNLQNQTNLQSHTQTKLPVLPTNMGQLLPPVTVETPRFINPTVSSDTIKTPKIVSAVSLATRAAFAPFINKGLQITAVSSGKAATPPPPSTPPTALSSTPPPPTPPPPPPPPPQQMLQTPVMPVRPSLPTVRLPGSTLPPNVEQPTSFQSAPSSILRLPFALPDNTNIMKCLSPTAPPPTTNTISTVMQMPNLSGIVPPSALPQVPISSIDPTSVNQISIESKIPATVLARPHLTPASQLNANEIMIELISSVNGNQLVVHGPPLEQKYSLPMSTTAMLIREVLSIPYLHKKDYNKPAQVNMCWLYLAKRFNLPVHICKACWNFLSENFTHFPQIAPLDELTKPAKIGIKVWRETTGFFKSFNDKAAQMRLPHVRKAVEKFFDNIRDQTKYIPRIPGKKLTFVADWQAAMQTSPHVQNKVWFSTWTLFKNAFTKYMRDLELGIDNKWSLEWWRVLAKLDFLLEEQYHNMEPFYYIVRNKMIAECERCVKEEQKLKSITKQKKENANPLLQKIPDIDAYRVILAIRRYPQIYQKATEVEKTAAWEQVALELNTNVTSCRFAFQCALKNYRTYVARDPANRCRLNQRYYKHMADIYRFVKPMRKLNIKTPSELNQSVNDNVESNESVFPERFIMDMNMSNSNSNVVMKNWGYGLSSGVLLKTLEGIFQKYRPPAECSNGS